MVESNSSEYNKKVCECGRKIWGKNRKLEKNKDEKRKKEMLKNRKRKKERLKRSKRWKERKND